MTQGDATQRNARSNAEDDADDAEDDADTRTTRQ